MYDTCDILSPKSHNRKPIMKKIDFLREGRGNSYNVIVVLLKRATSFVAVNNLSIGYIDQKLDKFLFEWTESSGDS